MSSVSGAGGRRMSIRSISCRGVRAFVLFQKPPLYATVSLGGRREKTQPDADGGENPDWDDAVFAFDLDRDGSQQQQLVVEFEVKAQVPILGNKLVATASVPVADLAAAQGRGGDGAGLRHVSYQVSAPDGKPNGTLSFAYAFSGGPGPGATARPQLYQAPAPGGSRPDQDPSFCCAPPPTAAYPPPAAANFLPPQSTGYPPPASASLYPPVEGLLSPRNYPPPPPAAYPQFPAPNNTSYTSPAAATTTAYPLPPASCAACPAPPPAELTRYPSPLTAAYPPPPASCAACPAPPPPAQYTSYPPPPSTNYPPAPPSGYPPLALGPLPASNLAPPTSTYPPPPESGSAYSVYPRSATPGTLDRALPYYPAPPVGSYYPPPGTRYFEVDGAARTPSYYPPPSQYP